MAKGPIVWAFKAILKTMFLANKDVFGGQREGATYILKYSTLDI